MSTRTGSSAGSDWAAYKQCDLNSHSTGIGTVTHTTYGYNGNKSSGPFEVKVVNAYTSNTGNSTINQYNRYSSQTWNNSSKSSFSSLNNAHIYHVHVSSIPSGKTLGYPVITGTLNSDNTSANANTISPAFMIASQLGATTSGSYNRGTAYDHCKDYIEVTYRSPQFSGSINGGNYSGGGGISDWIVYSDWRLPTAAEIEIIGEYQNNNGAVAVVLGGRNYYALTGNSTETYTLPSGNTGNFMRCVRDVKPGDPNYDN